MIKKKEIPDGRYLLFAFYRDGGSGADFSKDVAAAIEVDARVNGK